MKKSRLRLDKPVKMLTLVANPGASSKPATSELVPWQTRTQLSGGRAQRVALLCAQQMVGMVTWLFGAVRRASGVAGVIRTEATKAMPWNRPRFGMPGERLPIPAPTALDTVSQEGDLAHEVRMLRAQVQTQNKILAELTYVLMEERHKVRESDQLTGEYDRRSESRLLQVLQANGSAEEDWGTSKPSTSARVSAD